LSKQLRWTAFGGLTEGAMNGAVPYFFFPYSQADSDDFLDRFFEELRQRVANLSGLAIKKTIQAGKSNWTSSVSGIVMA
jgi:hypothetical protein